MKTNQAGMECWPRASYAGSAPSKILVTKWPNLGATLKRKIHFEDLAVVGKSSDKHPDEEIILAATYESALDMDKEDSVESSDVGIPGLGYPFLLCLGKNPVVILDYVLAT